MRDKQFLTEMYTFFYQDVSRLREEEMKVCRYPSKIFKNYI